MSPRRMMSLQLFAPSGRSTAARAVSATPTGEACRCWFRVRNAWFAHGIPRQGGSGGIGRLRYWGWLVILVALFGAACTNNPYPPSDAEAKILYESFGDAPKTLDPAVAYSTNEHEITGKVMDTLLEYHYLLRPYTLIPGLARKVPEPEPLEQGRVRYRFELWPDLWFQEDDCFQLSGNGRSRRITAEDFAFELMRLADPAVNSPAFQSFLLLQGFQDFHDRLKALAKAEPGFERLPAHERYQRAGGIEGVRTPAADVLEIYLTEPYPQILYWFAMPFTTPVSWEAVEYYDGRDGRPSFADHPVGSGPYMVTEYDKQLRIVLERNPNWHGARHPQWRAPGAVFPVQGEPEDVERGLLRPDLAGQPLPFIDRIELRREKESIPRFGKFLQGYYDKSAIIAESFDMVVQQDALSPEMAAMGVELETSVVPDIFYLGFNMEDPLVGLPAGERGRKLRQAMSLVVDVREYTRIFANGRGIPAQSPIPPGIFGYDEEYENPYRHRVDYERAKQLLEEAGYPGGIDPKTKRPLRLTFDTPNTSPPMLMRYRFFVQSWRRLGLDVAVDATSYNQFQDKMRRNAYQLFMWGWIADYPDPENFLFLLWSQASPHPNSSRFKNAEFDRLFLEMKAMANGPERYQLIRQMIDILERERPWIELYHSESYALFHSWLRNVKPAGLSIQTAKYHDLDPIERAQKREQWNRPIYWPLVALLALVGVVLAPGIVTYYRERQ